MRKLLALIMAISMIATLAVASSAAEAWDGVLSEDESKVMGTGIGFEFGLSANGRNFGVYLVAGTGGAGSPNGVGAFNLDNLVMVGSDGFEVEDVADYRNVSPTFTVDGENATAILPMPITGGKLAAALPGDASGEGPVAEGTRLLFFALDGGDELATVEGKVKITTLLEIPEGNEKAGDYTIDVTITNTQEGGGDGETDDTPANTPAETPAPTAAPTSAPSTTTTGSGAGNAPKGGVALAIIPTIVAAGAAIVASRKRK